MAKARIVFYKSKKYKNGTSPIMLRITKNGRLKYFKLGDEKLNINEKQWNSEYRLVKADKRLNPEHESINGFLSKKLNQANKIIEKYDEEGIAWTFGMFEQEFRKKPKITKIKPFFELRIQELRRQDRFNSADSLDGILNIMKQFDSKFDKLYFQDIDYDYILKFYTYLKTVRKNKDTTIGITLRGIRGILNDAISIGVGSKEAYPFSTVYGSSKIFKISKLEKRSKKRFIPVMYLKKLNNTDFLEPHLNWAKQIFLFSFFASGLNFKDMAFLSERNIKISYSEDGKEIKYLELFRKKTNQSLHIPMTPEMEKILIWAKHNKLTKSSYLLPIITKPKYQGEKLNNHLTSRRKRLNKHLRTIAKKLEFPEGLLRFTIYYGRHSYATTMLKKGVQTEKISEALGHKSIKTTQVYLDSFGIEEIAKLNENLLD